MGFGDSWNSQRTRVIRITPEKRREIRQLPQLVGQELSANETAKFGSFEATHLVAEGNGCQAFLAHDNHLNRRVFVYQWDSNAPEISVHRQVNRPGRVRWIQGGVNKIGRWEAFEFVDGIPLSRLANFPRMYNWENTRYAIHDILAELDLSIQDESLPSLLCQEQLLITRSGVGKILDLPFPGPVKLSGANRQDIPEKSPQPVSSESTSGACELVQQMFAKVLQKQILPNSVRRILDSFEKQGRNHQTIGRFADTLESAQEKLPRLNWDSRLGILAVTVGAEATLLAGTIMLASWFWVWAFEYWPIWKPGVLVAWFSIFYFGLGFCLQGSPVFRFMKIDVQKASGGPASRLRCGIRNCLAWLPFTIFLVALSYSAFIGFEEIERQRYHSIQQARHLEKLRQLSG